jgi:hypothetical protein
MSNRVASTSPCTSSGCGRTKYQIERPATAAITKPTMMDGKRLGGGARLAASLSFLTGSLRALGAAMPASDTSLCAKGATRSGVGVSIAHSAKLGPDSVKALLQKLRP